MQRATNISPTTTSRIDRITDVSSAEWRWVIIFSTLLVTLTLLPYAWAFASDTPNDHWQFMGILSNPQDGATYFAKISEGLRGQWLFTLAHTPEASIGTAFHEFYLFIGHLGQLIGLTPPIIFHLARLADGFVMYIALYHLGATIWQRLRARRLFFGLIAVGSGLGWLATVFLPWLQPVDLYVPEAIPMYAAFANPHFPLAIALIALIASTFVGVFRLGYRQKPSVANGGLTLIAIAVALAFIQPQAWLPIAFALCLYLVIQTVRTRKLAPAYQIQWVALVVLPALPVLLYDELVVLTDPLYKIWNAQNQTPSGSPLNYIVGFGLLLLVGLPGIWRALRRFEQDGDRLMLIWLISNTLLLYAPFNLQRRLVIGLIIPVVYFAVRSLEEFWFQRITAKWRDATLIALFVFIIPSNIFVLLLPLVGIAQPQAGITNNQLLSANDYQALGWLHDHTTTASIVLAPPKVSLWIPALTPARVVYGHPFETINAALKLQEVKAWYTGHDCGALIDRYQIQYVIIEQTQTPTACLSILGVPAATFGNVTIYAAHTHF